jgi:hypothetical protein
MKKIIHFLAVLNILAFVFCSSSLSADFGVFLQGSSGSGEFEPDDPYDPKFDIDTETRSFGFVLDTATTDESVFNYRLNVGYSSFTLEDDYGDELDSKGIYADNIFGFALMKSETFRWWLGPSLIVGYYSGDDFDVDYSFFEFGVGIVSGMNFKLGSVILSPSIGVRWNGYGGIFEEKGTSYEEDFTFNSTVGFLNLALLF